LELRKMLLKGTGQKYVRYIIVPNVGGRQLAPVQKVKEDQGVIAEEGTMEEMVAKLDLTPPSDALPV